MAHWHSLAKLRLHTDITLAAMDRITVLLGEKLRQFQKKTCSAFATRELNRERDARIRRQSPKVQATRRPTATPQLSIQRPTGSTTSSSNDSPDASACHKSSASPPGPSRHGGGRRQKTFNLNTYKFHALGDYAATIRQFGTTDSYTTEMVRLPTYLMFHLFDRSSSE
jgi:hypothetical protein